MGIILFLFYQIHLVKQARAKGEGYDGDMDVELELKEEELPSFATSILPLVAWSWRLSCSATSAT